MADRQGYSVRLASLLAEETVQRILDGMWRRLERENGAGSRTDTSEPSLSSSAFIDHCVEWTPT